MTTTTTLPAYANHIGWSDVTPYEVVRVISDKSIDVRLMNAERDKGVELTWAEGGFAGHCANQSEQKWTITSNPDATVTRIRLHKDGNWYGMGKARFMLSDSPRRFYDFNF
jgi:hypothetical protein